MGLFGGKKDGVKITDYFSAEDLQNVSRPDKVYSRGKMNSFAKVADAMKEIEPSLAEILQNAVNKIRG